MCIHCIAVDAISWSVNITLGFTGLKTKKNENEKYFCKENAQIKERIKNEDEKYTIIIWIQISKAEKNDKMNFLLLFEWSTLNSIFTATLSMYAKLRWFFLT